MSDSVAGLPYAIQSTAVDGSSDTRDLPLMNRLDQQLKVLKRGSRHHPVAEIEDVPRAAARAPKHIASPLTNQFRRSQEDSGIQVSLDPAIKTDATPTAIKRDAPVERDDVRPRRCDRLQQTGRVGAEVDGGHAERGELFEDGAR